MQSLFEKSLQELPEVAAHLEELEDTYGPPASPTMSGYGR